MRLYLFIAGILVLLMGTVWALQGALILPATFMAAPEWIYIGGAVAALGAVIAALAWRAAPRKKQAEAVNPSP